MTQQEKIKLLAEKVMGWSYDSVTGLYDNYPIGDKEDTFCAEKWNPFESWADCGMLIEKVDNKFSIELWNGHPEWRCRISKATEIRDVNIYDKSFCRCVSEAIFQALIGGEK